MEPLYYHDVAIWALRVQGALATPDWWLVYMDQWIGQMFLHAYHTV